MQHLRASITRLKSGITTKLPDGTDIYGYAGISKQGLIGVLDQAYGLSYKLAELEGRIEITFLKRKVAGLIDVCKSFLEDDQSEKKAAEKFNAFLSALTSIYDEIHLAYYIYTEKGIRTEAYVEKVSADAGAIKSAYDQIKPQFGELTAMAKALSELRASSEASKSSVDAVLEEVNAAAEEVGQMSSKSSAAHDLISKYEEDTKRIRAEIVELVAKSTGHEKNLQKLNSDAAGALAKVEKLHSDLKLLADKNEEQQAEIARTIENASRYGMASSFKQRKDELGKPIWAWTFIFVASVGGLFWTGIQLLGPYIKKEEVMSPEAVFVKAALLAPLVWLGWMAAKQYGYLSRIREDYSFKYASALAYEGFKKEAQLVDDDLLRDLLRVATKNMALNPLRIYDTDNNHVLPINDFIKSLFGKKQAEKPAEE